MEKNDQWCFAWFPEHNETGNSRAALAKNFKWSSGLSVPVAFLDGDPQLQERVIHYARVWTSFGLANLTFNFIKDPKDALIRISFNYPGSWSNIGTSCKNITDKAKPTMNYGWLARPGTTEEEIRRVVLHEFGHALGLIHEHLSPAGGIKWKRQQVIDDLKASQGWSEQQIEVNMFAPWSAQETNFTALDRQSIMLYPIPPSWTEDGFSVGLNTDLSAVDKAFIGQQYP